MESERMNRLEPKTTHDFAQMAFVVAVDCFVKTTDEQAKNIVEQLELWFEEAQRKWTFDLEARLSKSVCGSCHGEELCFDSERRWNIAYPKSQCPTCGGEGKL